MEILTEKKKSLPNDWDVKPIKQDEDKKTYSADDLIDAYFKGAKDQKNKDQQTMMDKLEQNIKKAQLKSEEIYNFISKQGFSCKQIMLRVKDIYRYTSIYIIDEKDYCNDKFLEVYKHSVSVKKDVNQSKTFDFTIIFTPDNKNLDKTHLLADGYILSYGGVK